MEDKTWKPDFQLCLCPNKDHFNNVDKSTSPLLPRCCPQSKFTIENSSRTLSCYGDETTSSKRQCPYPFKVFDNFEYDSETDMIKIQSFNPHPTKILMDRIEPSYCVGPSWHIEHDVLTQPIKMKLFRCKPPCDGEKPCVR